MSCAACQAAIERAVGKMAGVRSAVVNLLANTLSVEYDEAVTGPESICREVSRIGYGASPHGAAPAAGQPAGAPGAVLSLVRQTDRGWWIKKDGVSGWYDGEIAFH